MSGRTRALETTASAPVQPSARQLGPIQAARVPIRCFAGGRDRAVPLRYFYAAPHLLERLGQRFRFTIEADMGLDVWARVYPGSDVYAWRLQLLRSEPAAGVECRG